MSQTEPLDNRVKSLRQGRGWTQQELAQAAGLSRTGISAIESQRLTPSVGAALAIARALDRTVEELFRAESGGESAPAWAWQPAVFPSRYWAAEVAGRHLRYPVESTASGATFHDGIASGLQEQQSSSNAARTLVMACCDPAAGLLAALYERQTGFRLLVLARSSREALDLLTQGLVHVAGVHLSRAGERHGNATAIRQLKLRQEMHLLHVARWQEGIAVAPSAALNSARQAVRANLRWVGRLPGAGARRCQDELLAGRAVPRRSARDHRGVVDAINSGWAEIGVCVRLVSEEAQLAFLPVCEDNYDLCYRADQSGDPRLTALMRVVRSTEYRRLLDELPGYRPQHLGETEHVAAK